MTAALVGACVLALGFAATAVALALRQSGIVLEREKLRAELDAHKVALESTSRALTAARDEADDYREGAEEELRLMAKQLESIRDAIAELPETPETRELVLASLSRHGILAPTPVKQ